jgi:hypothetical protein
MTNKTRATTIQQKFGFRDDDLRTPKHDEIMLWLNGNIKNVIGQVTGKHPKIMEKIWEYPLSSGRDNQYVIGFIDMLVRFDECITKDTTAPGEWICFEVKTSIPSLGELIRQVNFYQKYLRSNPLFVIVSPDNRFATALRSQGIEFYHYNPNPLDAAMQR